MADRVVIVGLGGIGGVIAASMSLAGRDVFGVSGNSAITAAIRERGLRALMGGREVLARLDVADALDSAGPRFDAALLAVPPGAAENAARLVMPHLQPGAPLVCFQNGLMEERLQEALPGAPIVGGVIAFGASMIAPGRVERTSEGGITLGRLDGAVNASLSRLQGWLSPLGPIRLTTNLRGARWSKLAINCAVSSLGTLGGERLGVLMRHRFVRRLGLEVMTEVTAVAQAEGVVMERLLGTLDPDWLALEHEERLSPGSPSLLAKHAVLLAVGAKYRRLRSSMLSALERGRVPPVDFLNGEVVLRADRHHMAVPVNRALAAAIRRLTTEDERPSLDQLRRFYDDTRRELRALSLAA